MKILKYKLEAYIPFDKNSIEKFLFFCEETINNITTDEKKVFRLKSAAHELLINSLEHGYNKNAGKVTFSIESKGDSILLEMSDEGSGLDISSLNLERHCSDLQSINGRGWGLMILKKLSDNMTISSNTPNGTKISILIST
ncbi:UNVERIFIED_CONTAM: stage II sporulation protein AB (anti-sigma F factor) [Acetivibrio alkalicellulosi]